MAVEELNKLLSKWRMHDYTISSLSFDLHQYEMEREHIESVLLKEYKLKNIRNIMEEI